MPTPWLFLLMAGGAEIAFTVCLKLSEGFRRPGWAIAFLALYLLSAWLLSKAIEHIPIGTAYAIWTGIGATGAAVIGMMYFGDPRTAWRIVFLVTLIGSIVGLRVVSSGQGSEVGSQESRVGSQ